MNYNTAKKLRNLKYVIIDIILFPVRLICAPFIKMYEKHKGNKKYSNKEIRKVVQYLIDYWSDSCNNFYIIADDNFDPFGISNIKTLGCMQSHMSWGWYGENKKIKEKARHIYHNQKDKYIDMFKELLGKPMTLEEKKNDFGSYQIKSIKNRIVYKISKASRGQRAKMNIVEDAMNKF